MSNTRMVLVSIATLCLLLQSTVAVSDELRGTAEEAQALVAAAVGFYDENGQQAAFAAIEDKTGEFVDHDLYIFVYGPGRTIVAHGADVGLNGTLVDTLIDINGKPFGAALMDGATAEGVWIEYTWYNPVTRELHPKSSWVVRHDNNVFGAGIYLPDGVESGAAAEQAETIEEATEVPVESSAAAVDEAEIEDLELESAADSAAELMDESMEEMMDESAEDLLDGSADETTNEVVEAAEEA